jgi:hypothetical protein
MMREREQFAIQLRLTAFLNNEEELVREREIFIRLRLPHIPSKWWLAGAIVAVLCIGAVVYATVPNTFNTGDSLSSKKINDNFNNLDGRISAIEAEGVVNTTTAQASIAGNKTFAGDIVVGRHLAGGGVTPKVLLSSGAGSSASATVSGTDTAGSITISTGSGTHDGELFQIAFNTEFATAPHCVVSPANGFSSANTAVVNTTTKTMAVSTATVNASCSGCIVFNWICIQ